MLSTENTKYAQVNLPQQRDVNAMTQTVASNSEEYFEEN